MACIYNLSHVLSPGYVWHATLLQIWFVSDTAKNLTKLPTRNDQMTRHSCPTVALDTTACIYEHCFPIATSRHLAWKGFRIEMSNFLTTQPLKEDETWKLQQHSTAWIAECKVVAIVRTRHAMNHALLWHQWNLGQHQPGNTCKLQLNWLVMDCSIHTPKLTGVPPASMMQDSYVSYAGSRSTTSSPSSTTAQTHISPIHHWIWNLRTM